MTYPWERLRVRVCVFLCRCAMMMRASFQMTRVRVVRVEEQSQVSTTQSIRSIHHTTRHSDSHNTYSNQIHPLLLYQVFFNCTYCSSTIIDLGGWGEQKNRGIGSQSIITL